MYNNCNQSSYLNCTSSILLTPGPQGEEGATGPTGPVGIDGIDGINVPNNFMSLQLQDTDFLIDTPNVYVPLQYLEIASQQGNDILVGTLPVTEVTLTAGHTYLIAFNTNGAEHASNYDVSYRVVVNGVAIPNEALDPNYVWLSNTDNLNHIWIYTATINTTIEYQMNSLGAASIGLSGIYLTIITLV